MPTALVVIPCLNEAAHLDGLIANLLRAPDSANQFIVVADGGSDDGSIEIAKSWAASHANVKYLHNPGRLQSVGVNAAVDAFGEGVEYLVRIDAHAHYPAHYVHELLVSAQATGAASVVVPMVAIGKGCFQTAASTAQNSRIGTGGSAHRSVGESHWVDHGHHALMRLDFFRTLGGYDPRFSHNEDAEYDMRLSQAGGRIWLNSKLALDYLPRQTPAALGRQYLNYGRGRARTVRLHNLKLRLRQAAPLAVVPAFILAVAALCSVPFTPWGLLGVLPLAGWASICLFSGVALGLRAKTHCAWMAGLAAMIMHAAWSWGFWQEALLQPRLRQRQPDSLAG